MWSIRIQYKNKNNVFKTVQYQHMNENTTSAIMRALYESEKLGEVKVIGIRMVRLGGEQ